MDPVPDEEGEGRRWARRSRGDQRWLRAVLVIIVVPILIGAGVVLVAGRGLAFEIVRRLTVRKFPDVQWITGAELARWREDPGRTQPVLIDARTQVEYQVSHLRDAVRVDAGRPVIRVLKGRPLNEPLVVYGSVGYRGARLAHWLAGQGFTNVRNLTGGIFEWTNEDRPLFRDGRPTAQVHPYDRRWGFMLESRFRAPLPDVETPFAAP